MALNIFCSWCGEHQFKIDPATARYAGIVEFACPKCRKVTSVSGRDDGTLFVLPGSPSTLPGASSATDAKTEQTISLAKEAEEAFTKNDFDTALAKLRQLKEAAGLKDE